ncbi:MAG: EAL domain-containing protein [Candidatus Dormibacteria bacterium]
MPSPDSDILTARLATQTFPDGQAFQRAAFDGMHDCVIGCDETGRINVINRAMATFLGLEQTTTLPESWAAYGELRELDGATVAREDAPLRRALRGERVEADEFVVTPASGRQRRMVARGLQLVGTEGAILGAIVFWHDVTDLREAQSQLHFQAMHDTLTGLPNRGLFLDSVRTALERGRRYGWSTAVFAVNLDRFADIANRLGGDASNELLGEVAGRLGAALRPYDSISQLVGTVARLGGDQFLMLCEDVADVRTAELIARRVDAALRIPIAVAGENVSMTAGIGFTLTSDPRADPEALILEAETAMHRAKQRGAGCYEPFAREMRAQLHARIDNEDGLRGALDRGEFRVAYQPKVSLLTNRTVGVEALLRWDHPERGLIPPLDFIPLAEESGLIIPIGAWVLAEVCREAQRWPKVRPGGRPLMVAVNVSPRQFDSGLATTFGAIIAASGIDATTVCLEVTESMVMQDAEFAITTLRELKALGLSISIDDFGTGFSSLAYLKRFPLDELKIDKSFVDGLGQDSEATAIVAAVMGMAHALGLRVVAEGVETGAQAAQLRMLGCDEAQGYHFARPGTPGAVDELLMTEAARHPGSTTRVRGSTQAERVLVVDDTADVRQLAHSSLASAGFEVQEAQSGEEAITLATSFRPDCVVLDVNLPGLSGLEVCRILRDDPENRHLTIVILTGDAGAAEKVEAFSLKADDYIVKPFSPRDLVSRVTVAMRRRAESPAEASN